jgi:hypothetical protein
MHLVIYHFFQIFQFIRIPICGVFPYDPLDFISIYCDTSLLTSNFNLGSLFLLVSLVYQFFLSFQRANILWNRREIFISIYIVIQRGFIVIYPHMFIMYFDKIHYLYFFCFPFLLYWKKFNEFCYSVFIHVYEVLWSHAPSF